MCYGIYGGGGSPNTEGEGSFLLGISSDVERSEVGGSEGTVVWGSPNVDAFEVEAGGEDGDRGFLD
jgi:hypothetical protein